MGRELYKYITGTVQGLKQKMIAINGVQDHIHFLIGIKPTCCISDLMCEIKKSSTEFIKEKNFLSSGLIGRQALVHFLFPGLIWIV